MTNNRWIRGGCVLAAFFMAVILVAGAETAYRDIVAAYNGCRPEEFLAGFQDPLDCFFNRVSVSPESTQFKDPVERCNGYEWVVDSLRVEVSGPSAVVRDEGTSRFPDGGSMRYRRAARMIQSESGRWVITSLVEDRAHRCWADAF